MGGGCIGAGLESTPSGGREAVDEVLEARDYSRMLRLMDGETGGEEKSIFNFLCFLPVFPVAALTARSDGVGGSLEGVELSCRVWSGLSDPFMP